MRVLLAIDGNLRKDGDAELLSEGVPMLLDATSLAYLDGSVIDFDDGLQGKGFEIKNPNAQSTCGCGSSFQLKEGEEAGARFHLGQTRERPREDDAPLRIAAER